MKKGTGLVRWAELQEAEPEFAERVRALFDSRRHKVLATLRRDGSPRLSGIELSIADGEAWIGSMPGSRKGVDLARDSRLSVQATSEDPDPKNPSVWAGDARLSGRAVVVDDPRRLRAMATGDDAGADPEQTPGEAETAADGGVLFRIEINEAVLSRVAGTNDHMVIESWTAVRGYQSVDRY